MLNVKDGYVAEGRWVVLTCNVGTPWNMVEATKKAILDNDPGIFYFRITIV